MKDTFYIIQIIALILSLIVVIICFVLLTIYSFRYTNNITKLMKGDSELITLINKYNERYNTLDVQAKQSAFCSMFKGIHKKICS